MTLNEIITTCAEIANRYGVELVDNSENPAEECATIRLEYYKRGEWIGGVSFIGCAARPDYITARDLEGIEEQIKYLSRRKYA